MSTDVPRLVRFTGLLDEHGISVEPALSIVAAIGTETVFVGVGTLSGRVQLLVPTHPDVLAIVAPAATLPERSMLLISLHRDEPIAAAAVIGGPTTPERAVDEVGPAATRQLWLPIITSLSGGSIRNRTRYLGYASGTITLVFPERSGPEESSFVAELTSAATRLGVPSIWRRVYDEAGPGGEIGVTTECTAEGPRARLALRFGRATWDRAIDLAKALVDTERARDAAVRMGMLAGGLEIGTLRGVEAVVDQAAADLVVWLDLDENRRQASISAGPKRTAGQVVAHSREPAAAWTALVTAGLLPAPWANDRLREFQHEESTLCEYCGGYGECYAGCVGGYCSSVSWMPFPKTIAECAAYAEKYADIERYEALLLELLRRAAQWLEPNTAARPIVRWRMYSSERRPQVLRLLEPAWYALRKALPDLGLPDPSPVQPAIDWAAQGDHAWRTAVARGLLVPEAFRVEASCVGRAFADLPNPFESASAIEALPFNMLSIDTTCLDLCCYDPRGSGG